MATGLAAPTPQQFFLDSGAVNAGGTVETYLVGTSTPVATFNDYDLVTPNATTVQLDAAGRPQSGGIYLSSSVAYKFIEKDALGATVKTYNIAALFNGPFSIAGNLSVSGTLSVTGAATFSSTLALTGNFTINTNKFTVTAANGNTAIAGTLGVTGDFAINTNKFTVTAASGETALAGNLTLSTNNSDLNGKTTGAVSKGLIGMNASDKVLIDRTAVGAVCAGTLSVQSTAAALYSGTGSPETVVTAVVGSLYLRTNGGASTTLYVKESGSGNTGWIAK